MMTMTQKIMAAHAGLEKVIPGQLIECELDMVHANDITAPPGIAEFNRTGAKRVFDKDKITLIPDHFAPNKDIKSAQNCKEMKEFAQKHEITNYYEIGEMGIEHCLIPEKGLVAPGDMAIGADSHTCTYGALGAFSTGVGSTDFAVAMATGKAWFKVPEAIKIELVNKPAKWISGKDIILHIIGLIGVDGALYKSMEYTGDGIKHLNMDDRFTVCNMAVEAGAKNGIFPADNATLEYIANRVKKPYTLYEADEDATYSKTITVDLSALKPTISFPHSPGNTRTTDEIGDIKIDQVVIGSCTNGRISDLQAAYEVLKGRKVQKGIRLIIIPGSQEVYLEALQKGFIEEFIKCGAAVSTPTCGPCLGGHMGILAKGEKAVSTTNRNFLGRMGHPESEVYLSSPAVAAASATKGKITDPQKLFMEGI